MSFGNHFCIVAWVWLKMLAHRMGETRDNHSKPLRLNVAAHLCSYIVFFSFMYCVYNGQKSMTSRCLEFNSSKWKAFVHLFEELRFSLCWEKKTIHELICAHKFFSCCTFEFLFFSHTQKYLYSFFFLVEIVIILKICEY